MALIKCPRCGSSVSDKAEICPKCRNDLSNLILCPECGTKVLPGALSCPECGYPFSSSDTEAYMEPKREKPEEDNAPVNPVTGEVFEQYDPKTEEITVKREKRPQYEATPQREAISQRSTKREDIKEKPHKEKTDKDKTRKFDPKIALIIGIAVLSAFIIILASILISKAVSKPGTRVSEKEEETVKPEPEPLQESAEESGEEEENNTDEKNDTENEDANNSVSGAESENGTVSEPEQKEEKKSEQAKDDVTKIVYPKPGPGNSSSSKKVQPPEEYHYTPVNANQKLWNDTEAARDLYRSTVSDKLSSSEFKDRQLREIALVDLDLDDNLEMIVHWSEGTNDYLDVYGYEKKGTLARDAELIFSCAADRINVSVYKDVSTKSCYALIKNKNGFVYQIDGEKSRVYYRKKEDGTYTVNADIVSAVPSVYARAISTPSEWNPAGYQMLDITEQEFKLVNDALTDDTVYIHCNFTSPYDKINADYVKKTPDKYEKTWDKTWDNALYQYEREI